MKEQILFVIYIALIGAIGTGVGGLLACVFKTTSVKFLCSVLEFSAGLMITVVFFDLLPNATQNTDVLTVILGIATGVFFMEIAEIFVKSDTIMSLGRMMAIGIALHNFPEGLALGVALDFDKSLATTLMFAIFMHDIPEGLAVAIPLKLGGMSQQKIFYIACITGLATGLGGAFGVCLGDVSSEVIGFSLAVASGAMLYIVLNDIIPNSKVLYKGKMPFFMNIFGIIVGLFISCKI